MPSKDMLKYTLDDLKKEAKDFIHISKNTVLKSSDTAIHRVLLLLMVVNDSEFFAAMNYFSKSEEAKTLNFKNHLYYIGKWVGIPAALVQQNNQGHSNAQQLTHSSIGLFKNLKVIIALGVCGTVNGLGNVIVSSRIDGCDITKIIPGQIINRAQRYKPGQNILSFFKSDTWSYQCTKQNTAEYTAVAVLKPMLSGCPLIASGEYRDQLMADVSQEAGGVEMEGIGVIEAIESSNKRDRIEFIIVKAGCDYADETKNKEWQPVAAMAAADFVYCQLDNEIVRDWFKGNFKSLPTHLVWFIAIM